jgi:Tol biopolymer transport system component
VFVLAVAGGQPRRLTGDPAPKGRVAWNAKGDLAFSAASGERSQLFTVAPDGTGRREVLSAPEPVLSLCWAPDGRSLLVGLQAGGATRLRVAAMDGKLQDLGLEDGLWPQWVRNPAPALARSF